MAIFNDTPYCFFPFDTSLAPTLPSLTLIVRGTFSLPTHGPALAKPKAEQGPPRGDEQHLDELGRSLAYSTDLVPMKPRGEVLVYGSCYTPESYARPSHDVGIQIGPISKVLHITGPRAFVDDMMGRIVPGRTAPFTVIPLRWELAFGGMSFLQNPMGRGIEPTPDDNGNLIPYLPCIEYPESRMTSPKDMPVPAGFGPIAPHWMPRLKQQGTRDQRWATFRAPLLPKDFDPGFYNAAPADQQLKKGYFKGDEPVVLTGMHPTYQRWATSLPGKRVRVFALVDNAEEHAQKAYAPEKKFVEVRMHLDTVHIDADKAEMVLVWRGQIPVKTANFAEIEDYHIAEEDAASEPALVDEHHARYLAMKNPAPPPEPAKVDPLDEQQEPVMDKVTEERMTFAQAEITKILTNAKADPKIIAQVNRTKDPQKMFELLEGHARTKIGEIETLTAKLKAH